MEVPDYLAQQVRASKVALFLGAGASMGAIPTGTRPSPSTGQGLGQLLADHFLGGKGADRPLSIVAEYCIIQSDLRTTQAFVADVVSQFDPAPFHKLVADFKWAALATTNYDQLIERAYAANNQRLQTLVPLLRNTDRVDYALREADNVALMKLHGCVTVLDDPNLPLILTIDQYNSHLRNREKLFRRFEEIAAEYTVVFVGYRLEDPNIREVLRILESPEVSRPRHYVVAPGATDLDKKLWASKRIDTLDGTFKDFMEALDKAIPKALRGLHISHTNHPIAAHFKSRLPISDSARSFLENDVMHVHSGMLREESDPKAFFKGASYGWGAHQAGLDSARSVTDTVLASVVLSDASDRPRMADAYLIKGHAGAGKTVILKRIALDAATSYEKHCLYLRSDARISVEALAEIAALLGERLFLFVDGVARRSHDIESAIKGLRARSAQITVLLAERTGEWNVECQAIDELLDDEYEVRALSGKEIDWMIDKLGQFGALGLLEGKPRAEQLEAFHGYADRQMLVALYEITNGKPFEDIVFDEYKQIASDGARRVYLTVCALNRLGVPVRAGLVHRVTGISLSDFKRDFFKPLEAIVLSEIYTPAADMAYRARHPSIAQIVFAKALPDQRERFDLYINLLDAIDIGYNPDRTAYRELVRTRNLTELFSDPSLIENIFDAGHETGGQDGYLFQQCAIFEMKRPNGDLDRAQSFLAEARELLPNDRSITHSQAELEMVRATAAKTDLERRKFTDRAKSFAQSLTGPTAHSAHGYTTLAKIEIEKLRVLLRSSNQSDDDLIAAAKAVQQPLHDGLQHFRNDVHLLMLEAEFQNLLKDTERAENALRKANSTNHANIFVAIPLARLLESKGDTEGARGVLKTALRTHVSDKRLNASMARLIQKHYPHELPEAELHWKRSFTAGDTNYSSQFWYARALYLNGKPDDAWAVFSALKVARVARDVKTEIAGWVHDASGKRKKYDGVVTRLEDNYAWVTPFGQGKSIYLARPEAEEIWTSLRRGDSVAFSLGFNYMGPAASIKASSFAPDTVPRPEEVQLTLK